MMFLNAGHCPLCGQVGARVEGMERLVESLLAPGGGQDDTAPAGPLGSRDDATKREKLERIKADFDAAGRIGDPHVFFHMKVKCLYGRRNVPSSGCDQYLFIK